MTRPSDQEPERWDAATRGFHWMNAALILLLLLSGLLFMFRADLQIAGKDAKMALKGFHSWIGYAFAITLLGRAVWLFIGPRLARWRSVVPDRTALRAIPAELHGLRTRRPATEAIRSPVSRLSATLMFAAMLLMATTGLVRTSTDLYRLPFGPLVAAYVARPGVDPSTITWQNETDLAQPYRLALVTKVKLVAGPLHEYGSWVMLALAFLHVSGVTLTEIRQRTGLISAMVSGEIPPLRTRDVPPTDTG
jgi:Ni/Fe-hydrogenase 1 B-type cytochrome subunit